MGRLSLRVGCPVTLAARRAKSATRPPPAGNGSTAVRNSPRCTVGQGAAGGDDDLQAAVPLSLRMGWGATHAATGARRHDARGGRARLRSTGERGDFERSFASTAATVSRHGQATLTTRVGPAPPGGCERSPCPSAAPPHSPLPAGSARCSTPTLPPQRSQKPHHQAGRSLDRSRRPRVATGRAGGPLTRLDHAANTGALTRALHSSAAIRCSWVATAGNPTLQPGLSGRRVPHAAKHGRLRATERGFGRVGDGHSGTLKLTNRGRGSLCAGGGSSPHAQREQCGRCRRFFARLCRHVCGIRKVVWWPDRSRGRTGAIIRRLDSPCAGGADPPMAQRERIVVTPRPVATLPLPATRNHDTRRHRSEQLAAHGPDRHGPSLARSATPRPQPQSADPGPRGGPPKKIPPPAPPKPPSAHRLGGLLGWVPVTLPPGWIIPRTPIRKLPV